MQSINEALRRSWPANGWRSPGCPAQPKTHGSNNVYKRLRERGYQVFAVNPGTGQAEGNRCYRDLASIPGGMQAWSSEPGPRSPRTPCANAPSPASSRSGRTGARHGQRLGRRLLRPDPRHHRDRRGCPLMFGPIADFGHKIMRTCTPGTCLSRCEPVPGSQCDPSTAEAMQKEGHARITWFSHFQGLESPASV